MPSRPTRLLNQSQLLEGQSVMRISDQLCSYDDTSSSNEDQSKVQGCQLGINYSNTNGNAQSPSVAVPTNVKENILKVRYFIILACIKLYHNSCCTLNIWVFGVHHYMRSTR